jgi:glycosyltransferase involved in cell wall biosynthesis
MPLLSIITITYNAEQFLERTLQSVLKQSDQHFEYLIIDGKSKDSTLSIAEKYKDRIDVLISEPDNGLYDAMNKGQAKASGKYIWFMNAGDEIADENTVSKLLHLLKDDPDVVYSDTYMVDNVGKVLGLRSEILPHKVPEVLSWEKFKLGMLICHQSFVVKKSLAQNIFSIISVQTLIGR